MAEVVMGTTVSPGDEDMAALRAALPRFKNIAFAVLVDWPPGTADATGAALVDKSMFLGDPGAWYACIDIVRQVCMALPAPPAAPDEGRPV